MARARIRKRKADRQAEPRGLSVDANEPLRVIDLGYGRERRVPVNAMQPPGAVRRQTRQPEREKSPDRQRSCPRFAIRAEPRASGRVAALDSPSRPRPITRRETGVLPDALWERGRRGHRPSEPQGAP